MSRWRTVWKFLQTLEIELSYDPEMPLLGIYLQKTLVQEDTCIPVFIATLFTTGRTCKQSKYSSTEEWIKKRWQIYTMEYYSAIKKNKTMPFVATQIYLEIVKPSEVSLTQKDKYNMISLICGL